MIKDNQKSLNHVQVLLDAVVTAVAYILAWFIIVSGKVVPLRGATLGAGTLFSGTYIYCSCLSDLKWLFSSVCTKAPSREEGLNLPISVRQM